MQEFKRIMVGLDFSPLDSSLIEYAAFVANLCRVDKIYFIHIRKDLSLPASIENVIIDNTVPIDERLKYEMSEKVKRLFPHYQYFNIECEVIEGSPTQELLHRIEVKQIDLLIAGRKPEIKGSGVVIKQIARNSKCSIWFVPEKATTQIERILVPTDFSKISQNALEYGIFIAEKLKNTEIFVEHIYTMPQMGSYIRYAQDKVLPLVENTNTDMYNEFMEDIDTKNVSISPIFTLNESYAGAFLSEATATAKNVQLIIAGSQGKNAFSRLVLGSFTEKLLDANNQFPMLILKPKIA
ncbi:MAG: universal stress protein [Chitinophagales bacterium]|nr:universal stress protein [Bacteroidota bacterium]MCB9043880.1 universal stress protein [Chitinophagales bacterium]